MSRRFISLLFCGGCGCTIYCASSFFSSINFLPLFTNKHQYYQSFVWRFACELCAPIIDFSHLHTVFGTCQTHTMIAILVYHLKWSICLFIVTVWHTFKRMGRREGRGTDDDTCVLVYRPFQAALFNWLQIKLTELNWIVMPIIGIKEEGDSNTTQTNRIWCKM